METDLLKLKAIKDKLVEGELNEELVKIISKDDTLRGVVEYYNNTDKELTKNDIYTIEAVIITLQYIYNNTDLDLIVPDDEYDKLYQLYNNLTGKNIVGSTNVKDRPIGYHKYPDLRGTLDKAHFVTKSDKPVNEKRKSIEDWLNSCINRVGRNFLPGELEILLTPKWDGFSVILECENGKVKKALTRGDVTINEAVDLSVMFSGLPVNDIVDTNEPFGLKTEVVMNKENYEKLIATEGSFTNQRSIIGSILNVKELERKYLKYLTILPLQYQVYDEDDIPEVVNYEKLNLPFRKMDLSPNGNIPNWDMLKDNMDSLIHEVSTKMEGVMIDGIVIRLLNKNIQSKLGRDKDGGINMFEVAYKLPPQTKKTKIKSIEFTIGLLGSVTPVAKVEPIKIKGNTIQNISLGSVERCKELNLAEGDEVIIKYDVIPYLEIDNTCEKSGEEPIEIITHCPYCKEQLVVSPVLKCDNNNCPTRQIGKIINYVEKMKIPFLNEGIITTLYKEKILCSIEDLYRLKDKKNKIISLDGFGEKLFDKIISGIDSRRKVYDYTLIGSIGIPYIGVRISKRILDIYYLGEFIHVCNKFDINKLYKVEGIKEKTAMKIIEGVNENKELIMFLNNELEVIHEENDYVCKVCFTRVRDREFESYLETHKVKTLEKYSKEVDILIVPDNGTQSTKIDKAIKQGKKILTLSEAYKYFNYN